MVLNSEQDEDDNNFSPPFMTIYDFDDNIKKSFSIGGHRKCLRID